MIVHLCLAGIVTDYQLNLWLKKNLESLNLEKIKMPSEKLAENMLTNKLKNKKKILLDWVFLPTGIILT